VPHALCTTKIRSAQFRFFFLFTPHTSMLNDDAVCFLFSFYHLCLFSQISCFVSSFFLFSLVVGLRLLSLGSGIAGTLQPPYRGRDIIVVVVHLLHDYACCFTTPPSCHTSLPPLSPVFLSVSVSLPLAHVLLPIVYCLQQLPSPLCCLSVSHACVFPILSRVVVYFIWGSRWATTARVGHQLYDFDVLSPSCLSFASIVKRSHS
jgi:hypothetical protein